MGVVKPEKGGLLDQVCFQPVYHLGHVKHSLRHAQAQRDQKASPQAQAIGEAMYFIPYTVNSYSPQPSTLLSMPGSLTSASQSKGMRMR